MNKRLLILFIFLILLLTIPGQVLAGAPQPAAAAAPPQTGEPTAIVATGALNVRSGPGVAYGVVTVVYQGQTVWLLGRNQNASWVQVRLANNVAGWVNASLLQSSVAINSLPVIGTQPPAAVATVTTGAANVRSGPGLAYGVVAVVYQGQTVSLTGRNDNGSWVKVTTASGAAGWVNASLVQANVPISSLPVVGAPAPAASAIVTTGALNVRSGPGVAYSVVTVVGQGQQVALLGRTGDSSWVKVQTGSGATGWVNASLVKANVPISSLPVAGAGAPAAVATVTTGALNVRQGPDVQYGVVAVIYQGQSVSLIGRVVNNSWVQVRLGNGVTGWVNASLVQANVPIGSLPVTW